MVLYTGGNNVVSGLTEGGGHAMNGRIIRLGATACENHFSRAAIEYLGNPLSGLIQGVTGFLPYSVDLDGLPKC